jgi:hypothetical protein
MTSPSEDTPHPPAEEAVSGVAYAEAIAARNSDPRELYGSGKGAPEQGPREPYDPLKLCVYATVALLAWLFGPWAVLGFAGLGFTGYWRARRAGLRRSKCLLRDTRLVLAYLALIALVAVGALVRQYLPR